MKEPALGLVPDLTGTKPLVDLVGLPRAIELCLTARTRDRRRGAAAAARRAGGAGGRAGRRRRRPRRRAARHRCCGGQGDQGAAAAGTGAHARPSRPRPSGVPRPSCSRTGSAVRRRTSASAAGVTPLANGEVLPPLRGCFPHELFQLARDAVVLPRPLDHPAADQAGHGPPDHVLRPPVPPRAHLVPHHRRAGRLHHRGGAAAAARPDRQRHPAAQHRASCSPSAPRSPGLALFDAVLSIGQRWYSARIGEGLIYDLRTRGVQACPAPADRVLHQDPDRVAGQPAEQRRDRGPAGTDVDAVVGGRERAVARRWC